MAGWLALASIPALAGPPFLTDDPEPVDLGHWEFYTFSMGTRVKGGSSGVGPAIEVNYGVAANTQLHLIAPIAYNQTSGQHTEFGYGDTELGVKYRFVQEDEHGPTPMIGVFPLIELPTGDSRRGLGSGHLRAFLPVWLQKSFGEWTTYGGGGYWINPGDGNKNYWFAGWLLQRQVTDHLVIGLELFHQTSSTLEGRSTSGYNFGGVYDLTDHHHLLLSAGRGLQNVADNNTFSYYAGYQYTF